MRFRALETRSWHPAHHLHAKLTWKVACTSAYSDYNSYNSSNPSYALEMALACSGQFLAGR